jgi:hypothetical protein
MENKEACVFSATRPFNSFLDPSLPSTSSSSASPNSDAVGGMALALARAIYKMWMAQYGKAASNTLDEYDRRFTASPTSPTPSSVSHTSLPARAATPPPPLGIG